MYRDLRAIAIGDLAALEEHHLRCEALRVLRRLRAAGGHHATAQLQGADATERRGDHVARGGLGGLAVLTEEALHVGHEAAGGEDDLRKSERRWEFMGNSMDFSGNQWISMDFHGIRRGERLEMAI